MQFEEFNISGSNGKSNCVIRSLSKVLNKDYDDVYNNLCELAHKLNQDSFNDIVVFETYMVEHNIVKQDYNLDMQIKNLILDNDAYVIFCYDKKEFYHMIPIINNVVYDKNKDYEDLYVISIYKKMK